MLQVMHGNHWTNATQVQMSSTPQSERTHAKFLIRQLVRVHGKWIFMSHILGEDPWLQGKVQRNNTYLLKTKWIPEFIIGQTDIILHLCYKRQIFKKSEHMTIHTCVTSRQLLPESVDLGFTVLGHNVNLETKTLNKKNHMFIKKDKRKSHNHDSVCYSGIEKVHSMKLLFTIGFRIQNN